MKAHIVELKKSFADTKTPLYIAHHNGALRSTDNKLDAVLFDDYASAALAAMYWMLGTEDAFVHKVDVPAGTKVYRSRLFLSPIEEVVEDTLA